MTDHLHQLEALCRDPRLQVPPEQRAKIVENIIHSTMHPYFLRKSPEEQEQFRPHYLHHMQMLADYCLREYIETPEPRLTIEVVKGLHRVLYHNSPTVPVKAMDGSMMSMTPGEFKTVPVYVRRNSEWVVTPRPENMQLVIEELLNRLHEAEPPLFPRYLQFMLDFQVLHPFPDSNGKVGLLLGDLFLLKQGLHPPYISRYWWSSKQELDARVAYCAKTPEQNVSVFYPVVLRLYTECGLGLAGGIHG